jgi:CTP:molybdopterin cytidylyltransferase MocA
MPNRVLVVPAAGQGSRLGADRPKALVPVLGRPMLHRLLDLYRPAVGAAVVVASPGARDAIAEGVAGLDLPVTVAVQDAPTGMLDAVLLGCAAAAPAAPSRVWITWCDQVAVLPATVERLAEAEEGAALTFPVIETSPPYIHVDRVGGRVTGVRQRREGDAMPDVGESDMGLFSLSAEAVALLPAYARAASPGARTGERNFLPFIPWLAARRRVVTIPATDPIEALGINTPDDLRRVEAALARR